MTGDADVLPKWTYSESVAEINEVLVAIFNASEVLNQTSLLPEASYTMQSKVMVMFDYIEALQPRYMYVSLKTGLFSTDQLSPDSFSSRLASGCLSCALLFVSYRSWAGCWIL